MPPIPRRSPSRLRPRVRRGHGWRWHDRADGQSLVEFSLVLTPLFLLLLGIIQFGFIFNTYVTLTNATREAARIGTIYVYDRSASNVVNDAARNDEIRDTLLASLNGLSKTTPNLANGGSWVSSTSGTTTTYTDGDIKITYSLPSTVTASDTRVGYRVTVKATYHQDLVIPLVANLLPRDSGGRLSLAGEVTMVIN
jgi:Flp pilus assembly protein TadG